MWACHPQEVEEDRPISLLLMADYLADPLWRRGSDGATRMVSLDRLPLTAELKAALRAWAARYDDLMRTDYEWPSDAERIAWTAEGRALLGPASEELGPAYEVSYHDVTERGTA